MSSKTKASAVPVGVYGDYELTEDGIRTRGDNFTEAQTVYPIPLWIESVEMREHKSYIGPEETWTLRAGARGDKRVTLRERNCTPTLLHSDACPQGMRISTQAMQAQLASYLQAYRGAMEVTT